MQATLVLFAVFAATVANTTVFATLGLYGRGVGLSELEVGLVFASSRAAVLPDLVALGVGRAPMMAAAVIGFGLPAPVLVGGILAVIAATLIGVREARASPGPSAPIATIDGLAPYLLVAATMVVGFGALQPTTAGSG